MLVPAGQSCRRGCAGCSAYIARARVRGPDAGLHPFQVWLDKGPGAHVLGFFLAPDDLCLLEPLKLLDQAERRKRIELLEAQQIDIVRTALVPFGQKVEIDLARTDICASGLSVRSEWPFCASSHSTRWNVDPVVKSAASLTHIGWRNSDFGVIRTSGLRKLR
jgi:hypothetical protein